jgi:hypothetical protein
VGVANLESIEHLIEREIATIGFRGLQVEREYCAVFAPAVNHRVSWAHELLPLATRPRIED